MRGRLWLVLLAIGLLLSGVGWGATWEFRNDPAVRANPDPYNYAGSREMTPLGWAAAVAMILGPVLIWVGGLWGVGRALSWALSRRRVPSK